MDAAALRPLGIGEILDVAVKIFTSRFGTMIRAVAVIVMPIAILTAVIQLSAAPDEADFIQETPTVQGTEEVEFDGGEFAAFLAAILVAGLLSWIATQLATAACFKIASGAYLDEEPTWRESLSFAVHRLRPLLWLSLLTAVLLGLAFLACIVPGIYFYAAWGVATPVLLLEEVKGRKALKRSRQLVRGRWWSVALALFLGYLLASVLSFALGAAFGVLTLAVESSAVDTLAQGVANTLAQVITTPFTAALVAVVYFDLRVRKEGFDIELLARGIGTGAPEGAVPPGVIPPSPRQDRDWPDAPPGWDPPGG